MAALSTNPEGTRVREMFASIAGGYDRANDVLSAGIHHRWRKRLVEWSGAQPGDLILDCATGTGDLAIAFKEAVGDKGEVIGTDFCKEMLEQAPAKAQRAGFGKDQGIRFEWADVTALPFPPAQFDVVSIAFGIRNVEDRPQALRELYRVLKPGGRLMVLEFGQPRASLLRGLYRFYSRHLLPRLGGWVTGRPEAYRYLEKSAAHFPCREAFLEEMKMAGPFRELAFEGLSGGIAYIYRGVK